MLSLDDASGYYTEDVMDFWRPNYRSEALVDGKYSTQVYMRALEACWAQYSEQTGRSIGDFDFYCYHIPFTKMAEKGHRRLARVLKESLSQEDIDQKIGPTLTYSKQMGNCYTASMYMGLASLLEGSEADISGKRVGFFSYGSGCVAEFSPAPSKRVIDLGSGLRTHPCSPIGVNSPISSMKISLIIKCQPMGETIHFQFMPRLPFGCRACMA